MTNFNKLIPVLLLILFQIGCAEHPMYQNPAPVYRNQSKVQRNDPSKSVKTYKYPETGDINERLRMQEIAPQAQMQEPIPAPVAPAFSSAIPSVATVAPVSSSPAVLALVSEADQNSQSGDHESAAVKIERALRIDSRNAALTYKLAAIRLKQEQPRLAEDLAKKAAVLAGNDRALKKRIWLLIAESKRLQSDPDGAAQAEQKAAEY